MSSDHQNEDRRTTERRSDEERRSDPSRAAVGERRVVQQRGVVASMTDALEDILKWERASERMLKVADVKSEPSSPDAPAR